jgi:DNA replication protein DnaC
MINPVLQNLPKVEFISNEEFVEQSVKDKITKIYNRSGIPLKYHFCTLEKSWSTEFAPSQKLEGLAKKRSQAVKKIIKTYLENIDSIVARKGIKLKFKDTTKIVTDFLLVGGKESGKTLLLSLIGQAAINKGYKVKFVNWSDYADRFLTFENRNANEDFFEDCLYADILIFDSVHNYNLSNNKFFMLQLDRLISTRIDSGKITICSFDSTDDLKPVFEHVWNRFTRETFTLHLPSAINETSAKRT